MGLIISLLSVLIALVATGLSFAPDVANSPRLARSWVRVLVYLGLTLAICPGAFWLFMLFGGPRAEIDSRGEFAVFYLLPAVVVFWWKFIPAFIQTVTDALESRQTLRKSLRVVAQVAFCLFMVAGVVQIAREFASGELQRRMPEWVMLLFIVCVLILVVALLAHVLGWIVGFWVDPEQNRELNIYGWGEGETQSIGCLILFGLGVALGILYGLVRFVKWAWE